MASIFTTTLLPLFLLLVCHHFSPSQGANFYITQYGARADGKSDISGALLAAWKEACASTSASKVVIPGGKYYLEQVHLAGPCKAYIEVNVNGNLVANPDPSKFKSTDQGWVSFAYIDHLTLSGPGSFDGQGSTAWSSNQCSKTIHCNSLTTNLRFDYLTNAVVRDITSINSKMFHINVLGCKEIHFYNTKIQAPANSPNTDGIHIGRSTGVYISTANIQTGDDCISLGDGSQHVAISGVNCGPGHGISIGSLGKYQNEQPVSGVYVQSSTLTGTQNGVRIKSWPASTPGVASDIHFENIVMNNVGNPIIIDQEYCPWNQCNNQSPSQVKINNVSFKNIRGTSTTQLAVKLVCSKSYPCQGVQLSNINLSYKGSSATSICGNVKPSYGGTIAPPACK